MIPWQIQTNAVSKTGLLVQKIADTSALVQGIHTEKIKRVVVKMADVKWIKITTDIFDDEKILLIESLPDAYAIITV